MENLPESIFALNPEMLTLLEQQVNRDLLKVGNHSFSPKSSDINHWIEQLEQVLKSINNSELNQLLYVVDLPENWSNDLLQAADSKHQLALAILQREWVKTMFRIQYSKGSNNIDF